MGLQHYTQDMSKLPLKYNIHVLFYTKYTHPTLICRGTDARTDGRTENIYSIFRDKLLLLGEHGFKEEDVLITCKGEPILIGVRDSHGRYRIPLIQQWSQWQPQRPSKQA